PGGREHDVGAEVAVVRQRLDLDLAAGERDAPARGAGRGERPQARDGERALLQDAEELRAHGASGSHYRYPQPLPPGAQEPWRGSVARWQGNARGVTSSACQSSGAGSGASSSRSAPPRSPTGRDGWTPPG